MNDFLTYALDCSPSGWSSWDWAGAWLRHQRPHGPTPLNEPRGQRVNVVEIAQRIFSSGKARNSGEFVSAYNRPQRIRFIVNICKLSNCWRFLLSRGRLSGGANDFEIDIRQKSYIVFGICTASNDMTSPQRISCIIII